MPTSRPAPTDLSAGVPQELQRRLNQLRDRYGRQITSPAGDRLEIAASRRRYQLVEIHKQIAELEQRAKVIRSELDGFGKGLIALVQDQIDHYEKAFPEAWSPTPVYGYRLWSVRDEGLVGARHVWETSLFEASCTRDSVLDEIPHTDERCGRLGCGVYATKEFGPLVLLNVRESDRYFAAGLVALTGKVVEHAEGYRAERAEVVALALIGEDRQVYTTDRTIIAAAFKDPEKCLKSDSSRILESPMLPRIANHLDTRKDEPWI